MDELNTLEDDLLEANEEEMLAAAVAEDELDETSQEFIDDLIDKIVLFMNALAGRPDGAPALFPYQEKFARRIIESVLIGDAEELTALFSRQSGKSETVANVVATLMILLPRLAKVYPDLLGKFAKGMMVGLFAPVESQAETLFSRVVSHLTSAAAREILDDPEIDDKVIGKSREIRLVKCGSFLQMATANPRAQIESKSYHLIIVDEAQAADDFVVRKSIHPMGAFYAATIVKTGTPTTYKGDFYKAIQLNKRRSTKRGGRTNHFEANWRECNTGEAPIWMGDFSFKPLAEVQVGDEIVGWEVKDTVSSYDRWGKERQLQRTRSTRRLTRGTVTAVNVRMAPVFKVTMASGKVIRCTEDHLWLSGRSKTATTEAQRIKGGYDYFVRPAVGRKLVSVIEPTPPLDPALERTASWLAGLWDGEGTGYRFSQYKDVNPEVFDRIGRSMEALGFDFATDPKRHTLRGGRQALVNFLNWCDPAKRVTHTTSREILRGKFMRDTDEIVSMEPDGEDYVYSLTTTTGNYVAWGYASKNCAKYNPNYSKSVRKDMLRMGEDSDEFQMSYNLKWLLERGMFVTSETMEQLGDKSMEVQKFWTASPVVVGIDPARKVDSTVVTVVWVDWDRPDEFGFYDHRVLNWMEIQGDDWEAQYGQIVDFLRHYDVLAVGIDGNGVGDAVAQRLQLLLPRAEVQLLASSPSEQSKRWKHLTQLIQRGLVSWPAHAKSRRLRTWRRFYQQMIDAEKVFKGPNVMVAAPNEAEAHDDYVDSLALACVMTADLTMPEVEVTSNPFYSRRYA